MSSIRRSIFMSIAIVLSMLVGCANNPPAPAPSAVAVSQLTPTGKLRVAINYGNAVLAKRDAATGELSGVSVDLSRELARRLGVGIELIPFNAANKSVEAIRNQQVDIAFFAIDPLRGTDTDYTAAYVMIEGTYVVRQDSPIKVNADVDKPGMRIAVAAKSAYDLFLSRNIKHATLVRTVTSAGVIDMFVEQKLDVAAGVKQQLEKDMKRIPGLRMLDGRFMEINQAMGTSKGRDAGIKYMRAFIEEVKASGFVARALERHHIEGVAVAPPAR
jgi:polar amino acid transport system substrate-binding protein